MVQGTVLYLCCCREISRRGPLLFLADTAMPTGRNLRKFFLEIRQPVDWGWARHRERVLAQRAPPLSWRPSKRTKWPTLASQPWRRLMANGPVGNFNGNNRWYKLYQPQCHTMRCNIELTRPGSCSIPVDVEQEPRVRLRRRSFEAGENIVEITCNDLVSGQAIDFVGYHHLGFVLRSGGLPSVERRFVPVDNVMVVLRPVQQHCQPLIFQSPSQVYFSFWRSWKL